MMLGYRPDANAYSQLVGMALAALVATPPIHPTGNWPRYSRSPGYRAHRAWRRRRAAGRAQK